MKMISVVLASTEVLDGVKRRPGDTVPLPDNHPVAVKAAAASVNSSKASPSVKPSEAENAG